jgi:C1A family cysteine protease
MPIRIVKDKDSNSTTKAPKKQKQTKSTKNPRTGLAGPLLPMAILAVAGIVYFANKGCNSKEGGEINLVESLVHQVATGGKFDLQKHDATQVFEPLADNVKNPIPNSVSLLKYAPKRLNQDKQGSCVDWYSSYAARNILQARMTGKNPRNVAFSPSFLYNQIALANCQGTYLSEAMKTLKEVGDLPFTQFSYDETSCKKLPSSSEKNNASSYKIKGYNRLTVDGDKYKTDMLAIKQNLAQGAPVLIGMMVGGTFMKEMEGEKVWLPTEDDYSQSVFGGHAMCVIGYDDFLEGGAFQIMNSWGEEWGEKGIGWVRYEDFNTFTKEAYGLYPMGNDDKQNLTKLSMKFGLVENQSDKNIPFDYVDGIPFKTKNTIAKGTQFKIESTNSIECYTYILGQETDGSSYVLFPYTPKHSPYCGITGTRLFPKDHSLLPDKNEIKII